MGQAASIGKAAVEMKQHSMKLATADTGTAGQTDAAVRKKMIGMMMEAKAEKIGMLQGRKRNGMMTGAGDIGTRIDLRRVGSMQGGSTGAPGGTEATGMMTGVMTGEDHRELMIDGMAKPDMLPVWIPENCLAFQACISFGYRVKQHLEKKTAACYT